MTVWWLRIAGAECLLHENLIQPTAALVAACGNDPDHLKPGAFVQLDRRGDGLHGLDDVASSMNGRRAVLRPVRRVAEDQELAVALDDDDARLPHFRF